MFKSVIRKHMPSKKPLKLRTISAHLTRSWCLKGWINHLRNGRLLTLLTIKAFGCDVIFWHSVVVFEILDLSGFLSWGFLRLISYETLVACMEWHVAFTSKQGFTWYLVHVDTCICKQHTKANQIKKQQKCFVKTPSDVPIHFVQWHFVWMKNSCLFVFNILLQFLLTFSSNFPMK